MGIGGESDPFSLDEDSIEIDILDPEADLSVAEQEKVKELLEVDPWDAVIYLAYRNKHKQARDLIEKLLEDQKQEFKTLLEERLKNLQNAPLTDGVLLSGPDEDGRFIIGVAHRRYDVPMGISPPPPPEELIPGREVWVDSQTMVILKLRDSYIQGEAAPVLEIIPATADEPEDDASTDRFLLKVKSRQEEIVVEAVPELARLEPNVGDIVRIISTLGIALSLLTRGRGDVQLGETPDVEYDDIGGLEKQINDIREAIDEPYLHPAVFQRYNLDRPRGILLYGPPGCGKTMIAKAIANNLTHQIEIILRETETALQLYLLLSESLSEEEFHELNQRWQTRRRTDVSNTNQSASSVEELRHEIEHFLRGRGVNPIQAQRELRQIELALQQGGQSYFVSIKGPELLSKWVGESESNIRAIFSMARERASFHTPVILFFDEIESMFSRRGSGISSDVQKTIVPQLLAEIDGVEETRNVIIIGATNRFDLIDPAVLRPGRLDIKIKIDRPNQDREAPRSILSKYLTPDIPFPPDGLDIPSNVEPIVGAVSARSASLHDTLQAALDHLLGLSVGAIFLTNLYPGNRVANLTLRALTGTDDAGTQQAIIKTWAGDDGIVWNIIQTGEPQIVDDDPIFEGKSLHAWPILSPDDDNPQVWGVLTVSAPPNDLAAEAFCGAISEIIAARLIHANHLIDRVIDILFNPRSRVIVTEQTSREKANRNMRQPQTLEKPLKDIISGAILASIVSRAKRNAVRREIETGNTGVIWMDLYQAIGKEYEESKDQYIFELYADDPYARGRTYHDSDRYHVSVHLADPDEQESDQVAWLQTRQYTWRTY